MAETSGRVIIDKDLRPAYYDDFHCLAAGCKWNCCKCDWNIGLNKKDYLALKRQKGSPDLNARIARGLRRVRSGALADMYRYYGYYGQFKMDNGVCPLLLEDGLCGLQAEKGAAVLPNVCTTFPRRELHSRAGCLERSLTPACEGVLALLWDLPEGIAFRSDPLPKDKWKQITFSDEDSLSIWFAVVREWCIDLLQNRRFSLPERIWIMGLGLRELAEDGADIQRWAERAAVLPDSVDVSAILPAGDRELTMFLTNCVRTLCAMNMNMGNDSLSRNAWSSVFYSMGTPESVDSMTVSSRLYRDAQRRYAECFGNREYFMENLMVSVFFYMCMPHMDSTDKLWKSYVNFCNLYGIYRFLSVVSCREGAAGDREGLFDLLVYASRGLLHSEGMRTFLRDEYFRNDSATLAHMAILLCG